MPPGSMAESETLTTLSTCTAIFARQSRQNSSAGPLRSDALTDDMLEASVCGTSSLAAAADEQALVESNNKTQGMDEVDAFSTMNGRYASDLFEYTQQFILSPSTFQKWGYQML